LGSDDVMLLLELLHFWTMSSFQYCRNNTVVQNVDLLPSRGERKGTPS